MAITCDLNFDRLHTILDPLQACLGVGPLLFSPLKAVVSLAQIVEGLAIAVFSLVALLGNCSKDKAVAWLQFGGSEIAWGVFNLAYSVSNFVSFGIVACVVQHSRPCCCCIRRKS